MLGALITMFLIAACGGRNNRDPGEVGAPASPAETGGPAPFTLASQAFRVDGRISPRYTCDGEDVSPPLTWSNPPEATASYALIMDDPDAPGGIFTHWILLGIPGGQTQLDEGLPKTGETLNGQVQPRNDFGRNGYGGPCPPPGAPHRYRLFLYALDEAPALDSRVGESDVLDAIEAHVLARAELSGTYRR